MARGQLEGIEAVRGIAATAVVLSHAASHMQKVSGEQILGNAFHFGHAGVDLFFVISGFIILHVHYDDIGRPRRLAHYLHRRFSRVMPIYWVALAVTIAMSLAGGNPWPSAFDLVRSAALLPWDGEPLLGVAWTLTYEIVFYGAFCLLIARRAVGLAVFALWLAGIAAAVAGLPVAFGQPASLLGVYNLEFFLGMAVAYGMRRSPVAAARLTLAAGGMLFAVAGVAEDRGLIDYDRARLIYAPASVLIVFGAAATKRTPAIFRALGRASYSIYLFQFVFIGVVWQLLLVTGLDSAPPWLSFMLLSLAGVAGGIAASRRLEYPLMRLVRRERRSPTALPSAALPIRPTTPN